MNNNFNNILPNNSNNNHEGLEELNDALNSDNIPFENENEFEQDAAEGLKQIQEKKITVLVDELNTDLKRQLKIKKKNKRKIPDQSMVYITIVTLLILVIVAYIVIKKIIQ